MQFTTPPKNLRATLLVVFAFAAWFTALPDLADAENWPAWRGPSYNGTTTEKNIPTEWNETPEGTTQNIAWRCELPEYGRSTPVVWGNALFLTTQRDDQLLLLKINKKSGQIEWTREVGRDKPQQSPPTGKNGEARRSQLFHNEHNMASPSCATDGQLVAVHFGNGDLAVYDFSGRQLWKLNMQKKYGPFTVWWGHANSPVLYGEYVIAVAIQDSCKDLPGEPSQSYIVAFDRWTGKEKWRTIRITDAKKEFGDAYTTPVPRKLQDRTELVVLGGEYLDAYDLVTGRRTWFLPDFEGNRNVTGPVLAGDIVVATHGKRGPMVALKLKSTGKQSEEQILWTQKRGTPDSSWPVVVDGLLFYVEDNGIAHCLDLLTGKEMWKNRLAGSPFRASVMTDGKNLYFTGTKGITTVVRAAKKFEKIVENHLDDQLYASPIVSDGHIFLRGQKRLYCIEK